MAEIGIAGSALLVAVRLHREDVGAIDQPLVRVGIVGADLLDEFVLTQHTSKMDRGDMIVKAKKGRALVREGEAPRTGKAYCSASDFAAASFADALQRTSS